MLFLLHRRTLIKKRGSPQNDKLKRSKKKPKAIKNTKLSSPRITRKMARQFEKAKEQVTVKNSNHTSSITPWKKKKKENPNDSPEEFPWMEAVVIHNE